MKELKKARMGMIAMLAVMLVSMKRRLPEARRLSYGITPLALAGIVLLVAVGTVSADTPINACQEITESGDYYLASNITDTTTVDVCIYITADDVTLDGQGHYIDGSTPGSCSALADFPGTLSGYARSGIATKAVSNVTIKNVEVENFCNGILLYGASEDVTVANCNVHDNGNPTVGADVGEFNGITVFNSVCNSTVDNNRVSNTSGRLISDCDDNGAGISVKKFCNDNDVTNNTVFRNTFAGIYGKKGSKRNYIFNNVVYENGQTGANSDLTGGIRFQCKSSHNERIENNTVTDNIGPGIFVGGNNCDVRNNTVTGSKDANTGNLGYGLYVDRYPPGGMNVEIYDNVICDNEDMDIKIQDPAQNPVGDRNTCDTGANYNDASATPPNVCTYQCTQPEEPDLIIEDIRLIRWCCCWIDFTKPLKGEDDSTKMQVIFVDDPELAKELGDEKLRVEVAAALADDPKLADEIAAKLADDDKKLREELKDPKRLAMYCCYRCNAIKELADLLDTELTAEAQHGMSDLLDEIVGGCCCNCITDCYCCCCCGHFVVYKIANIGDEEAGWSLSRLTVDGRTRSADIVRPLDAGQSRWEAFCCYRIWSHPHVMSLHRVTVYADATDWVAESDETNNCRTEVFGW